MSEINMLTNVSEENQKEFYAKNYREFVSNSLYAYLFEGLQLREIERKYLDEDFQGFFAKEVLNMMGVDTSKKSKNRGIFSRKSVSEIIVMLSAHEDARMKTIGLALTERLTFDLLM